MRSSELYNGEEPVPETNKKSHSQSDSEPVSDTNRKLPYDEIARRPPISFSGILQPQC